MYIMSNIMYKCPLKYMHTEPYINYVPEYIEESVNRDKGSSSILDKIIAASAKLTKGVDLDNEFVAHILEVTKNGKKEIEAIEKADEKVFTPEGHRQGLISPDCYNGKSILSDLFKEEDNTYEQ